MKPKRASSLILMVLFLCHNAAAFGWWDHHRHYRGGVVFLEDPLYPPTRTVVVAPYPRTVWRPSQTAYVSPAPREATFISNSIGSERALNTLLCQSIDRLNWLSQTLPEASGNTKNLYVLMKSGFENYKNSTYPSSNQGKMMGSCPVREKVNEDVEYTGLSLLTQPQVEKDFVKGSLCKSITYFRSSLNLFKGNAYPIAKNVLLENLSLLQLQLKAQFPGETCPIL